MGSEGRVLEGRVLLSWGGVGRGADGVSVTSGSHHLMLRGTNRKDEDKNRKRVFNDCDGSLTQHFLLPVYGDRRETQVKSEPQPSSNLTKSASNVCAAISFVPP